MESCSHCHAKDHEALNESNLASNPPSRYSLGLKLRKKKKTSRHTRGTFKPKVTTTEGVQHSEVKKKKDYVLQIVQDASELFSSVHGLLSHLNQSSFRIAVGEVTDGGHSLVGIVLGQRTSLLDAIAAVYKLTSLRCN